MRGGGSEPHRGSELVQGVQHTIDFLLGVVVDESNSQETTALLNAEPLREIQRVVVAVPGEDTLISEPGGQLERSVAVDPHSEGGATRVHTRWVSDSIQLKSANFA